MGEHFDPNEHTVHEVTEYVTASTDADEVARVRAAEEAGKNRSSIEWPEQTASTPPDPNIETTVVGPDEDGQPTPDFDSDEKGEAPADSQDVIAVDPDVQTEHVGSDGLDLDNSIEDEQGEDADERPVWDMVTHGRPPESRKHLYRVVGA